MDHHYQAFEVTIDGNAEPCVDLNEALRIAKARTKGKPIWAHVWVVFGEKKERVLIARVAAGRVA